MADSTANSPSAPKAHPRKRQKTLISPPAPPAAVGVAVARLELALTTARRQLDERIALISAEDSACAPARAPRAPAQRHGRRLANSTANERSHPDATTSPGGPKTAMRGIGDLPPLPASIPQAATEVAQRREDHRDCGSREVTMTYTV
ncbi:MAG: hypothetical protein ACREQ5_10895, partial [Candidatus Dormibacteria bacterium]